MEFSNIENLLERYFEGETTLQEEQQLRTYFTGSTVAAHLKPYVGMFSAFAIAKEESLPQPVSLPKRRKPRWKLIGVAASVAIAASVFLMQNKTGHDYGTYKDPEVAALKAKQALGMMSQMLLQSTAQLDVVKEFDKTTNTYLK